MRIRGSVLVLIAVGVSPSGLGAQREPEPTFTKDVAPVLYTQCVVCHRPGGSAPFSLLTYDDARSRAALIAAATKARRMPPWLPEPGFGDFANPRRLTAAEIALLQRWAVSGARAGNPAELPAPPSFPSGWQLGEPDLVVELPAYTAPREGRDIYRNLVTPIPVDQVRYVNAVELRPGNAHVVHHARMMVDTTTSSRQMDLQDPELGFDGMDLTSRAMSPDGFFVGWTPGKVAARAPGDMGWPVQPGTDLVLQLHLRPTGEPEVVRPLVGLYFARQPPARIPTLLMLGSRAIDIPAKARDYVVTDSYTLPVDAQALGVYPHAHYLAREMQGFVRLPGGEIRWLLRIRDWDFNWQDEYRYQEPIPLPRGAVVTMRYVYDNSEGNPRNPNRPPKRVRYGPNSTDEMADLVIQVLPRTGDDLALLNRDLAWKYQADNARTFAEREVALAERLAARDEFPEAILHLRAALDNQADARVQAVLAGVLASQGEYQEALPHAREALRLGPEGPLALAVMARIMAEHPEPAIRDLSQALRLADRADHLADHHDALTLDAVAAAYSAVGARDRAIRTAEQAVAVASQAGDEELAAALRQRLEQYRRPRR